MSPIFVKLDVEVPDGPGIYSLPYPITNPTGNIIVLVAKNSQICLTYVSQPLQIFEDSSAAFADATSEGPIVDSVIAVSTDKVIPFKRTLAKTSV